MFRLPKSIRFEGKKYSVGKLTGKDLKRFYGWFEPDNRAIKINRKHSAKKQAMTLVHELCHVILDGLRLNGRTEERVVLRLEEGLTSLMEENPGLLGRVEKEVRQASENRKKRKKV